MSVLRPLRATVVLPLAASLVLLVSCSQSDGIPVGGQSEVTPAEVSSKTVATTSAPATSDKPAETKAGSIEYVSRYGFSFSYYDLILDSVPDGDRFADLAIDEEGNQDSVVVEIKKPDKLEGDPVEFINQYNGSGHLDLVNEKFTLDGYPAFRNEFRWKVMKTEMRTIVLRAAKDGYFYTAIATMHEDRATDETYRERFSYVLDTFHLLPEKIDLDQLEPWKEALQPGYPIDLVPLLKVDKLDYVSNSKTSGYFSVSYYTTASLDEVSDFYHDKFAGYGAQDYSKRRLECVQDGYEIEVKIEESEVLKTVRVSIVMKKK